MTTKRSPSPSTSRSDPTKQQKMNSPSPSASTDPSAQPSERQSAIVDPTSSAEPSSASAPAIPAGESAQPKQEKEQDEPAEDPSDPIEDDDDAAISLKVTLSSLDPIRKDYETKRLQGFENQEDEVYPHSKELNDKVYIWQGDITVLAVDCIVNAANKSLLGGGGVDGAIHSAAGPSLYDECKILGGAQTGETKLTSAHRLPSKHIAHTVGPIFSRSSRKQSEELLRRCYRGTLELCVKEGIRTVGFSGISTGVYGYPIGEAAEVACDEVRKFLEGPDGDKIDAVLFVVFRQVDLNSYLDNVPAYFPPTPSAG
ncbi:hypothetical protein JCM8547_007770 [Rhodosporidiobolus lusitaniae]